MPVCRITGQNFSLSALEQKLRADFAMPEPSTLPHLRIRHLGAFWPHWNLHKRKCDKTQKDIVSVFRPDCPYPIWHKDEWYRSANPPSAKIDFNQRFFPQAEKLFKQCPIAHHTGENNENCEYTDDAWHSKNCYLSHSLFKTEDCRYTYRAYMEKDSLYNAFCYNCERCIDCVNCNTCFEVIYSFDIKNSREMAFCFDCRGCQNCLFCYNLRNKSYCIGNKQYTKEAYEIERKKWDTKTMAGYEKAKGVFQKILEERVYFRALYVEKSESAHGNYLEQAKNTENAYYINDVEDICNISRGTMAKTCLDCVSPYGTERQYFCSAVQLKCYDVRFSFQLTEARFTDYCAYSAQIENCFGCCGMVRAKNCILNAPYSVSEYADLREKLIDHMKSTGEWGEFFPGSFAPNPYDESWSSLYFPLSQAEQERLCFFHLPPAEKHNTTYKRVDDIPLSAEEADESTTRETYWDAMVGKPFQILPQDVNLCRELGVPLPNAHYMKRIQENFRWMPYDGQLRKTRCAKSGVDIETSWPAQYDGRILCESEYIKIIN